MASIVEPSAPHSATAPDVVEALLRQHHWGDWSSRCTCGERLVRGVCPVLTPQIVTAIATPSVTR
jgi:hypothetical protein